MQRNPIGQAVTQYLTQWALPLGVWFIVEYLARNYAVYNLLLNLLTLPMMLVTAVAVFILVRRLRNTIMPEGKILGVQAWTFGIQLIFFAGLLEALFIWIFNAYLVPDNQQAVHEAMLKQLSETSQAAQATGLNTGFIGQMLQESADVLEQQPIPSAIEAAMSALSNDLFAGMFLMIPISLMVRKK